MKKIVINNKQDVEKISNISKLVNSLYTMEVHDDDNIITRKRKN